MGNAPIIPLNADVDSPTEPGKQSVISDEINVADYDAFFDEVVDYCKYLVGPQVEKVLKEVAVDEIGPDEFTVKVILDGAKLTQFGFGNKDAPDMPFIQSYTRFKADKSGRTFTSYNIVTGQGCWANEVDKYEGKAGVIAVSRFLKDPLRVEYHWETTDSPPEGMPPNTRFAGEMVKNVLSPILEGVASKFATLKVKTTSDAPSVFTKGEKSVISETLKEDEISFDALWDGMVAVLKESNEPPCTTEEVSDIMFKKTYASPDGGPGTLVRTITLDKQNGHIINETSSDKGLITTEHYVLNKSPLQLEAWEIQDGTRKSGKALARACQFVWNVAYSKATSGGSWFSW